MGTTDSGWPLSQKVLRGAMPWEAQLHRAEEFAVRKAGCRPSLLSFWLSGYIFIPFPAELLSLGIPGVAPVKWLNCAVAVFPGNFQAWFNLNSSPGGSSSAGYSLGLWDWQEKTLKLPLLLLSPSPHWSARKAWAALGQWTLQHTHLWETRLQGRFRREGRKGWSWTTPNSWDMTRKCKFGVMNSEQGHVKLWTFIKQRRKTVYQHCGWAYEIQEWVCVGACACERVKKKKGIGKQQEEKKNWEYSGDNTSWEMLPAKWALHELENYNTVRWSSPFS